MKVDNHADLPVYPAQADFTFFGGLYRQVELLIFADKAHFNVTEYGADSLLLTPTSRPAPCRHRFCVTAATV